MAPCRAAAAACCRRRWPPWGRPCGAAALRGLSLARGAAGRRLFPLAVGRSLGKCVESSPCGRPRRRPAGRRPWPSPAARRLPPLLSARARAVARPSLAARLPWVARACGPAFSAARRAAARRVACAPVRWPVSALPPPLLRGCGRARFAGCCLASCRRFRRSGLPVVALPRLGRRLRPLRQLAGASPGGVWLSGLLVAASGRALCPGWWRACSSGPGRCCAALRPAGPLRRLCCVSAPRPFFWLPSRRLRLGPPWRVGGGLAGFARFSPAGLGGLRPLLPCGGFLPPPVPPPGGAALMDCSAATGTGCRNPA